MILIVDPEKQIKFFENDQNPEQIFEDTLRSVRLTSMELKNLGNQAYKQEDPWAAINLYTAALGRNDEGAAVEGPVGAICKTLDENLEMILHGNLS